MTTIVQPMSKDRWETEIVLGAVTLQKSGERLYE